MVQFTLNEATILAAVLAAIVAAEPVICIGQTARQTLTKRISQFYRHKYGARSRHSGCQAVKLLLAPPPPRPPFDLWVYWLPAPDPYDAELMMICAFRKQVGRLQFANRG